MQPIRMSAFVRLCVFGLLSVSLSGCFVIFPKTEDLRQVHQTYRDEFHQAVNVRSAISGSKVPLGDEKEQGAFARTIAAITDYRRKYPDATKQNAHLDVLQGMIYLQTGRFGLASLMQEKVTTAESVLTGDGIEPRDALFAKSFGALLQGWKYPLEHTDARHRIAALTQAKTGCGADSACRSRFETQIRRARGKFITRRLEPALRDLTAAGRSIEKLLCDSRKAGALKLVEGDQGASYLAASGGIFYEWRDNLCVELKQTAPGSAGRALYDAHCKGTDLVQGRNLVGAFLPPLQRDLLEKDYLADTTNAVIPADRGRRGELGYLGLYFELNRRIANRKRVTENQMLPQNKLPDVCAP